MCNFIMGMTWWHSCLSFCCYNVYPFQKLVLDFAIFCTHMLYETFIGFVLSVSGQSLFIPNLGHLLWSLQSKTETSIGNEKNSAFHHDC